MSRKTAIIVLITIAVAIGLVALISYIPFTKIDPESMPVCSLHYFDSNNNEKVTGLGRTGYRWRLKDPTTGVEAWETAGPDNFFNEKYTVEEIIPGNLETHLQIVWSEPPAYIVMRRWPLTEWTPGGNTTTHSEGMDVSGSWKGSGKKTDIGFTVERGSLYGIWAYYGDAWVEYSFVVPAEESISYDYLGYISGFDESSATQFELDPIEMIDMSNTQRIAELNLNVDDDFPSGFYIYNPTKESIELRLTNQTKYSIIDPETGNTQKTVNKSEFLNHLDQYGSFSEAVPYWISETDGNVEAVMEQYLP